MHVVYMEIQMVIFLFIFFFPVWQQLQNMNLIHQSKLFIPKFKHTEPDDLIHHAIYDVVVIIRSAWAAAEWFTL